MANLLLFNSNIKKYFTYQNVILFASYNNNCYYKNMDFKKEENNYDTKAKKNEKSRKTTSQKLY